MKCVKDQIGWVINFIILVMIFVIMSLYFFHIDNTTVHLVTMTYTILLLIFISIFSFKIKVSIDDKCLRVSFGIGLIRRRFLLKVISDVLTVKNKFYVD